MRSGWVLGSPAGQQRIRQRANIQQAQQTVPECWPPSSPRWPLPAVLSTDMTDYRSSQRSWLNRSYGPCTGSLDERLAAAVSLARRVVDTTTGKEAVDNVRTSKVGRAGRAGTGLLGCLPASCQTPSSWWPPRCVLLAQWSEVCGVACEAAATLGLATGCSSPHPYYRPCFLVWGQAVDLLPPNR